MSEIARIADLLEETFEGKPYYGPSVIDSLEDVGADLASRRMANAHSIWELVIHLTAELRYARALLEGTAEPWVEGETTWGAVTDTSPDAWREAVQELRRANRALVDAIKELDDRILHERALPLERPFYVVLHGTMQHNVYHSGQISLLAGGFAQGEIEA